MVARQVLVALCVTSIAVAFGRSAVSEQGEIVSSVISALQPEVIKAVREALRGSRGRSIATKTVSGSGVDIAPYAKPEYSFQIQVSDDEEQTYIAQNEERDGTELSGSYSFVDANGDLVTVNYKAGVAGYEETREVQQGFIEIKPRKTQEDLATSASEVSEVGVNLEDLVSRVTEALRPRISLAVREANL